MQELIITGRTVDEAVEQACEQLGVTEADISYEVLELPAKKLFGSSPAKIKVSVSEEIISVKKLLEEPEPETQTYTNPRPSTYEQKPSKPRPLRDDRPRKPQEKKNYEPIEAFAPATPIEEAELPDSAKKTLEYLRAMISGMGADKISYSFGKTENGININLDGDDSSLVIGRRGETMEALQYLCSLTNSRGNPDYVKVSIDVSSYREKRVAQIQAMARKTAEKVLKQHRSLSLQPMNPYERRIVHGTIQGIEGVKSESVGSEPNRRVIISSSGSRGYSHGSSKPHGGYRGDDHDRPRTERRDEKPAPQNTETSDKPERAPTGDPTALYKKIEF